MNGLKCSGMSKNTCFSNSSVSLSNRSCALARL